MWRNRASAKKFETSQLFYKRNFETGFEISFVGRMDIEGLLVFGKVGNRYRGRWIL